MDDKGLREFMFGKDVVDNCVHARLTAVWARGTADPTMHCFKCGFARRMTTDEYKKYDAFENRRDAEPRARGK